MKKLNRRTMLLASAATGAAIWSSRRLKAASASNDEAIAKISLDNEFYCGWPTVARKADGELIVVYSGGRESHVCPFGRVEMIRSQDNGETWSWPQVLLDGPIDDRDAGVLVTKTGSILVTTFTSLAYESILNNAASQKNWAAERLAR